MHREEDERPAEEHRQQREPGDRHVHGEHVGHGPAQVVEDAPAQADRRHDGGEVVVGHDQRRRLAGHVGAAPAHRHADVGRLERRRVVDAVAGHRHDLARRRGAPGRGAASARARRARTPTCAAAGSRELPRPRALSSSVPVITASPAGEADLPRDGAGRVGRVAGDHHHAHAGPAHSATAARHAGAQRVLEAHQPDQLEVEVVLARRRSSPEPKWRGPRPGRAARRRPSRPREPATSAAASAVEVAQVRDRLRRALGGDHAALAVRATRQTWETASSSGESGYSRTSSQSGGRAPCRQRRLPRRWKACSIGSNGSRWLARIAELDHRRGRLREAARRPVRWSVPGAQSRATPMRFSVSVPVLSEQSTVAAPSASTAGRRRVSTRLCERRQAPRAMKIVSTTGNSSGSTAMASAMPARSALQPARRASGRRRTTSAAQRRTPSHGDGLHDAPDLLLERRRARSRGRASATPMRPISVREPVARTSASAVAPHDQRAGIDERLVVAARARLGGRRCPRRACAPAPTRR